MPLKVRIEPVLECVGALSIILGTFLVSDGNDYGWYVRALGNGTLLVWAIWRDKVYYWLSLLSIAGLACDYNALVRIFYA